MCIINVLLKSRRSLAVIAVVVLEAQALEPHPATQRVAGAEALGRGSLVREPSVRAGQSFEAVIQVRTGN